MEPVAPTDERSFGSLGVALALAATLAGTLGFGRVFPLAQTVWAALIGTGLGGLLGWWRLRRRNRLAVATVALTVVVALVAGTITAMVAAVPTVGNPVSAFVDTYHALVGGLHRVLTITLPVPPIAELLPLVAVAAAVAGVLSVLLAGSGRRVAALAPGLVVLGGALALGVGGPGSTVAVTLPYLAVAVANLGIEGWARAGRRVGRLLPIMAVGAVAIAVSLPAAQLDHALQRRPLNPRRAVSAALDVPPAADPLSLVPYWLDHPDQVLFTAQVGSAWNRLRPFWSLTSYDNYDGAGWSGQARAVAVGYQVPGSRPSHASESEVSLQTENLSGVWVPIPGPVHTVDRVGLGYAAASRELVDPSGVNGKHYRLGVYLPNYQAESLRAAAVPEGSAAANLVSVPSCVTPELSTLAHSVVSAGAQLPIQQAVALTRVLSAKSGFALDNNAPAGDSCARISEFLLHDHVGTSDQFATTFVLMARSIGLPARLVVGFEPGTASNDGQFVTVTGADAFVFPEVELARVGWVPIDATPRGGAESGKGLSETQLAEIERAGQSTPTTSTPPVPHHPPAPVATRHGRAQHGSGFPVLLAVAIPLGFLALAATGLASVTRVRRWRRRHARRPPPTRVALAWQHVLDRLVDHRVAVRSLTPGEAVEAVAPLAPEATGPVGQLGALVERAVYDTSAISEQEANQAWVDAVTADRELRRRLPRGTRWLTALGFHPRHRPAGTAPAAP